MFPRGWRGIVRTSCGRVATSPPPVMVHRFLLHGTCSGCVGARVALFPNSGSANGSIMPRLTAISTLLTAPPALTLSSTAGTLSLPPPPPTASWNLLKYAIISRVRLSRRRLLPEAHERAWLLYIPGSSRAQRKSLLGCKPLWAPLGGSPALA